MCARATLLSPPPSPPSLRSPAGAFLLTCAGEMVLLEYSESHEGHQISLRRRLTMPPHPPPPGVEEGDVGRGPLYLNAWAWEWGPLGRLMLATSHGALFVLDPRADCLIACGQLDDSPPAAIAHQYTGLGWGPRDMVVAAPADSDGHIFRLAPYADGVGLRYVDSLFSLAPIMDAVLLPVDDADQAHAPALLVACGGPGTVAGGTVRVLRPGAGAELLQASGPEYAGVTGAWGLGGASGRLLLCFAEHTVALALSQDEGGDLCLRDMGAALGVALEEPTLAAGALIPAGSPAGAESVAVQVTPRRARLCADSGSPIEWLAPDIISAAAVGRGWLALAMARRRKLAFLTLDVSACGGRTLTFQLETFLQREASCLALAAPPEGAPVGAALCLLGTYRGSVELMLLLPLGASCGGATPLCSLLIEQGVPHSLHMLGPADVVVGLRTGALVRLELGLDPRTCQVQLHAAEVLNLGTAPLALLPMPTGGEGAPQTTIALTDRAWLIRPVRGSRRIRVSPLWLPGTSATHAAILGLPDGNEGPTLLLAGGSRLALVQLTLSRRMVGLMDSHSLISLEQGCCVRRLLLPTGWDALVLACQNASGDGEIRAIPLAALDSWPLSVGARKWDTCAPAASRLSLGCDEVPIALKGWDSPLSTGEPSSCAWLVVGTSIDGISGRLVVISLASSLGLAPGALQLVTDLHFPDPCRCLEPNFGPGKKLLLAATGARLCVFSASSTHQADVRVTKIASAACRQCITALSCMDAWVLTGDGFDSAVLWSWSDARHELTPMWADVRVRPLCAATLLTLPAPAEIGPGGAPSVPRSPAPVVFDHDGHLFVLTPPPSASASVEHNLTVAAVYALPGLDIVKGLQVGSLLGEAPRPGAHPDRAPPPGHLVACTLRGGVLQLVPVPPHYYAALLAIERAFAAHMLPQIDLSMAPTPGGKLVVRGELLLALDGLGMAERREVLENAAAKMQAGAASVADLLRILDSVRVLL